MLIVATLINLMTLFASLVLLGLKVGTAAAWFVYLCPLPYNIFIVACIWRTSDLVAPAQAASTRTIAAAWLVFATII